jgi:hypothetical protein
MRAPDGCPSLIAPLTPSPTRSRGTSDRLEPPPPRRPRRKSSRSSGSPKSRRSERPVPPGPPRPPSQPPGPPFRGLFDRGAGTRRGWTSDIYLVGTIDQRDSRRSSFRSTRFAKRSRNSSVVRKESPLPHVRKVPNGDRDIRQVVRYILGKPRESSHGRRLVSLRQGGHYIRGVGSPVNEEDCIRSAAGRHGFSRFRSRAEQSGYNPLRYGAGCTGFWR